MGRSCIGMVGNLMPAEIRGTHHVPDWILGHWVALGGQYAAVVGGVPAFAESSGL